MKIRTGFVSNSSSSSFIIINKTNKEKSLVDFVKENPEIIEQFVSEFDWHENEEDYDQPHLLKSAEENNFIFSPNEKKICVFGDEDGTLIGEIFDYALRRGGESKSFKWRFHESLR
jgi:hypothetical protein